MAKFPCLPLILFYYFVLSDISGSGYNCLWLTKIISLITITRLGDYRKGIPENDLVRAFILISKHPHRQPGVSTEQVGDSCVHITEALVRCTHESQLSRYHFFHRTYGTSRFRFFKMPVGQYDKRSKCGIAHSDFYNPDKK